MLGRYCFDCHADPGPGKLGKGDLRLDGVGWIRRGGDGGRVLVAGDPEGSGLYARVALPEDDPDTMPPKGKRPTPKELERLRLWVVQGAGFGSWKGVSGPAKKAAPVIVKGASPRVLNWQRLGKGVKPASKSAIVRAAAGLASIRPVMPKSPLLRVSFHSREIEVTNAVIEGLAPIRKHITAIDLRRCDKITDAALSACGQMPRLTRLDLGGTKISDRGLFRLTQLSELRYLNLFGTRVTDGGLQTLGKLPALESVFIWQTKTTAAGAGGLRRRLKRRHPHARVVRDPGLPKPPADRR